MTVSPACGAAVPVSVAPAAWACTGSSVTTSSSVSSALLTVILTGRTAFHSAQGGLSSAESYVAGISDDFLFVTFVSLASALPFLWLLRPRRKAASFKSEGTGT